MMNKILIDGEHWYNLFQSDDLVALYYSNNEMWNCKGELVVGLQNTGNGYKLIQQYIGKNIEYNLAQELYILLSAVKECKIEKVTMTEEM
jgi:hypothetical protein